MLIAKTKRIVVTSNIIKSSRPESAGRCMGATAVREQIPGAWGVKVTSETTRFNLGGDHRGGEGTRFCYQNPARVGQQIRRYDEAFARGGMEEVLKVIKPFDFILDARQATTAPVVRTGERGPYKKRKTHKKHGPVIRTCPDRRHAGLAAHRGMS